MQTRFGLGSGRGMLPGPNWARNARQKFGPGPSAMGAEPWAMSVAGQKVLEAVLPADKASVVGSQRRCGADTTYVMSATNDLRSDWWRPGPWTWLVVSYASGLGAFVLGWLSRFARAGAFGHGLRGPKHAGGQCVALAPPGRRPGTSPDSDMLQGDWPRHIGWKLKSGAHRGCRTHLGNIPQILKC